MTVKNKMEDNGTFKIIICGGRHFDDYEYLKVSCDSVISQTGTDKEIEIVSGHCKGCDMLGEKYAQERGYKLTVFPAEWKKYGSSAGIKRNMEMVRYIKPTGGAVIGFFRENTRETGVTVEEAQFHGLKTFVFEYSPSQEKPVKKELGKEEYDDIVNRSLSSAAMKKYLKKEENRLGSLELVNLVKGSPNLSIYEKSEIINRLAGMADGDIAEELCHAAEDFKEAVADLSVSPGELLVVYDPFYDDDINDIRMGEGCPFTSFEKAMDYIEWGYRYDEVNTKSLAWYLIEKWAPDSEGNLKKKHAYYHIFRTGICWFTPYEYDIEKYGEYMPRPCWDYSYDCCHLNLGVPFRAGDIVRIDCAPFAPPVNALVVYSGEDWDCCGVLALYYRDGRYREGAVKHTDMWLKLFPELPLSPLYRLRKFNGKLTGNDAVYEEISKIINGDNATGDKIWELTYHGTIETPEELLEKIKEIL